LIYGKVRGKLKIRKRLLFSPGKNNEDFSDEIQLQVRLPKRNERDLLYR